MDLTFLPDLYRSVAKAHISNSPTCTAEAAYRSPNFPKFLEFSGQFDQRKRGRLR